MKTTFYETSKSVFDEIVSSSTANVDFKISDKIEYAKIEYGKKIKITMPKPITLHKKYYFEGNVFCEYEKCRDSLWNLYLTTIYHVGAHIQVSNYDDYKNWCANKTSEKCWNVINFVEDMKVDEYIEKHHTDVWQNMTLIKTKYDQYFNNKIQENSKYTQEKFSKYSGVENSKELWRSKFKETFLKIYYQNRKEITPYLDFLYKNQHLLPKHNLPYCDRPYYKKYDKPITNLIVDPKGEFKRVTSVLDERWLHETALDAERLEHFQKYARNSNFDKIEISPENHGEFMRINQENASDLRRLRTGLSQISFFVDSPAFEQIGIIDMPSAIQRVASEIEEIECFEQDIPRMESENWVVIFDNSASMSLRFEEMKKFILNLGETAEAINKSGGKWGLYSFNNKFLIVKDHKENYNQTVKARIGGMKTSGMSFITDAIDMGAKILSHDNKSQNKYLIIISDGKPLGTDTSEQDVLRALERAQKQRINLIGIGTPHSMRKPFAFTIDYVDSKKSVKKFISAYTTLVESG